MNIICIDPSLTCTAVVVNDHKAVFTTESTGHTKKQKLNKWFEITDPYVDFIFHSFESNSISFAKTEVQKLEKYDDITTGITDYITSKLVDGPSKIFIEGYSFSSAAGPLIDLVTFGTLLRFKLFNLVSNEITIIPPSELKLLAAKLTYQPTKEGKKEVWRNKSGVAGGKFKKHEMYRALIENDSLKDDPWVELLVEHSSDILSSKSVPKPIEDVNDAKLMFEIVKSNKYLL